MASLTQPPRVFDTDAEGSPLLRLPAELRNMIYRQALIGPQPLMTDTIAFQEPPLLLTCKEIRSEAAPLFFAENTFRVSTDEYKITAYLKWRQVVMAAEKRKEACTAATLKHTETEGSDSANWTNLVEWLRAVHNGTIHVVIFKPSKLQEIHGLGIDVVTVGMIFRVVGNMKSKAWHKVERLLKEFRVVLTMHDPRWNI